METGMTTELIEVNVYANLCYSNICQKFSDAIARILYYSRFNLFIFSIKCMALRIV